MEAVQRSAPRVRRPSGGRPDRLAGHLFPCHVARHHALHSAALSFLISRGERVFFFLERMTWERYIFCFSQRQTEESLQIDIGEVGHRDGFQIGHVAQAPSLCLHFPSPRPSAVLHGAPLCLCSPSKMRTNAFPLALPGPAP